jgi:hypothetical protein
MNTLPTLFVFLKYLPSVKVGGLDCTNIFLLVFKEVMHHFKLWSLTLSEFHQTLVLLALIKNKQRILSWEGGNGNSTENVQHPAHWTISICMPHCKNAMQGWQTLTMCMSIKTKPNTVVTYEPMHVKLCVVTKKQTYLQMHMKHSFCIL